jgi:hypothetical protein
MDTPQPSTAPYTGNQSPRDVQASQHLSAIAARLTDHGIASRLSVLGSTPVLTIEEPAAGPNPPTVSVDPDPYADDGPDLSLDCTCLWTPAPGTTPEATADTIMIVLKVIRRNADTMT